MGIKNELDVEIATVRAKRAGFAPEANAIETANGTSSTVAPTFDITSVNAVARPPVNAVFGVSIHVSVHTHGSVYVNISIHGDGPGPPLPPAQGV